MIVSIVCIAVFVVLISVIVSIVCIAVFVVLISVIVSIVSMVCIAVFGIRCVDFRDCFYSLYCGILYSAVCS